MKKRLVLILILSFLSSYAMAQCHGQDCTEKSKNRVVNGDFENDSAGILSDYQYTTVSSSGVGGYYGIFTDASKLTSAYTCPKDHTTGKGHMMCFDGFLDGTRLAWGQTIRGLDTGTTYYLNYWVANLGGGQDPATIHLRINGKFVTGRDTIATSVGAWNKRSFVWKSGSADTVQIWIFQYCSGNSGNNFALDDIELYSCDTILNPPKLELGNDKEICKGESVTLSATLNFDSYLWDDQSRLFVRRVNQTGTYWVKTTYQGCKLSDTITITVDSSLTVNLGNDTAVCEQNVLLDAGIGNVTYLWSTGATTRKITVDTSGIYTVTVTNTKQCKDASTVEVRIGKRFNLDAGPDQDLCDGDQVRIGTRDTIRSYLWTRGDTTGEITVSNDGEYILYAYLDGCEDWDTVVVSVHDLPMIKLGNDTAICSGEKVILNAGAGYKTYAWNTSDNQQSLEVDEKGTYSVTVTNSHGCSGSDTINLAVNALPIVEITPVTGTFICEDDSTILEVVSSGLVSYNWYRNGGQVAGGFARRMSFNKNGNYHVVATDTNGCTGESEQQRIHVNPLPVIVNQPVNRNAEVDDRVVFRLTDDGGNYTYQWQEDRGTGFYNLKEGTTYGYVNSDSLVIFKARNTMDGYFYRCWIVSDSGCDIFSFTVSLAVTLGIGDKQLPAWLNVYPNPSQGILNISSEQASLSDVQLLSLEGRIIADYKLDSAPTNTIDFRDMPAGVYLLVLRDSNGNQYRLNWVKN